MAVHDSPASILGSKYGCSPQGNGCELLAAADLHVEALDSDDVGELGKSRVRISSPAPGRRLGHFRTGLGHFAQG
jgi:hypothetical protein